MTDQSQAEQRAREYRGYVIGLVLAVALTGASFALVWLKLASGVTVLALLGLLAVVQIVVHFRFFLHIDLKKSHRDDLLLILFTTLIAGLMIGGTIWILFNQHMRMMP